MNLFSRLSWRRRRVTEPNPPARLYPELLEPRCLLSVTSIQFGAVYIEEDVGSDLRGDTFEVTFVGGAAGTELASVTISGDQSPDGFGLGDAFFDTLSLQDSLGAEEAFPLTIVSRDNIDDVWWHVDDGATELTLEFTGFHAGEKFVFSIDVDEVEDFQPQETDFDLINEGFDPITSGVEFQGSRLTADFIAPHHHEAAAQASFRNRYDEALVGTSLDLPADDFGGKRDRTAGAVGELQQFPLPVTIAGTVYEDRDTDLVRDAGDLGIGGVELALYMQQAGQFVFTGYTTVSETDGGYVFDESLNLLPGTYQIREAQPAGYFSVGANVGTVDGQPSGNLVNDNPDVLTSIAIPLGGQQAIDYSFAEALPASIAGAVHLSSPDGDCFDDAIQHQPVVGATILLLDADGTQVAETQTDELGRYQFDDLRPGTYSVVEVTPPDLIDGDVQIGQVNGEVRGRAGLDRITHIQLHSRDAGEEYEFCDHPPASLSGFVFHDRNNDGVRMAGEEGIADVEVRLFDAAGNLIQTGRTADDGNYSFERLDAGTYRIAETQPSGWLDGLDSSGHVAGQAVGQARNPGDEIEHVELLWGDAGEQYNFGELQPASLAGRVHLSTPDGDCFGPAALNAPPVVGAVVLLLDEQGRTVADTVTDLRGEYWFSGIMPGEYSIREVTPASLIDGGAQAGHVDGQTRGEVSQTGDISRVTLYSDEEGTDFDFCEHQPATLSGFVYHDQNNDGVRQSDEAPIRATEVILYDQHGDEVARTLSEEDGSYHFARLPLGNYSLAETQPDGWLDGLDSVGVVGGEAAGIVSNPGDEIRQISLRWSDQGKEFNFGELLPASLSGFVHSSPDENCVESAESGPLSGVIVELINDRGEVAATGLTDESGRFYFDGIAPGAYSLREQQPVGVFQGGQRAGTGGGTIEIDDFIGDIEIGSGQQLEDYAFCELPPAEISGYVFQDGPTIALTFGESLPEDLSTLRDGQLTADDRRLAAVVLELRDGYTGEAILGEEALPGTYSPGPIRAASDAQGFYRFAGLPAGDYAVYQIQPEGFVDGIDTPGTASGLAVNAQVAGGLSPLVQEAIRGLSEPPNNDAILRIPLSPGDVAERNNFSEVSVRESPVLIRLVAPPLTPPIPAAQIDLPDAITAFRIDPPLVAAETVSYGSVSATVRANTWHLSVIDGGQPRSPLQPAGEPVIEVASQWKLQRLQAGRWLLRVHGEDADRSAVLLFGLPDAIPITGDFNGDGVTEAGVFHKGEWYIDLNANGRWDPQDLWAKLGLDGDLPVTGDWDGDGKDDIGIFGQAWPGDPRAVAAEPGLPDMDNVSTGERKNVPPSPENASLGRRIMKLTSRGRLRADVIDHVFVYGTSGDLPVAGDWNGDGIDSVGVFRNGIWRLDVDGNGRWTQADEVARFGQPGDVPIVGDFDGDGIDDLAILRNGVLYVDANGNRRLDAGDVAVRLGSQQDVIPFAGDWDGDGVDQVGVYERVEESEIVAARPE